MTKTTRVYNESRKYWMKHKRALHAVEQCACAWVVFGESVRDLTLEESIMERMIQAKRREPLPFAELPGLVYRPAEKDLGATRQEFELARAANQFAAMNT